MLKTFFLLVVLSLFSNAFGELEQAQASEKQEVLGAFSQLKFHQRIDLSNSSPPFLKAKQVREDLEATHWLLKQNYARYHLLKKSGTDWDRVFQELEKRLLSNPNPPLTHHFQQKLMKALDFTEDPFLKSDLFLQKRHYLRQVEPKAAFYSGVKLVLQQGRHRVLPNLNHPEVANHFMLNCLPKGQMMFPIIGDRVDEPRFMLGRLASFNEKPLDCLFENELGTPIRLQLPLALNQGIRNKSKKPLYRFIEGHIPYLIWYREGDDEERSTRRFMKLARQLMRSSTLVLDVRGNHSGSFKFIEKWLKELTRATWENVIVREKQSIPILLGLINRNDWDLKFSPNPLVSREMLDQHQMQLKALLSHFEENEISEKWIETKFLFKGHQDAPAWKKRLIVVANEHCGDGCQFLAALAKQEETSHLVGSLTGNFPRGFSVPLYQLPHSRILLSINHRLHLNHEGLPVLPSGYQPDYWLFPEMGIQDVLRLAGSL